MNNKARNKSLWIVGFLSLMLAFAPFVGLGVTEVKNEFAAAATELLNPDRWFEMLKRNITIPLPNFSADKSKKGEEVKIPTPEEALKEASPQLQEVSRGVREETGIDLAKFIGWSAKVLKVFFQVIINLLEQVSKAMGG